MNTYWATGKHTIKDPELYPGGFFVEYNTAIQMWRINHPLRMPSALMGYEAHEKALKTKLRKFVIRNKIK